ncbi:uncharacterized protein LOC108045245 [Drosophila rhopaloa]|uniref:Uncharacterized protein LOC108045245 n=1 Tax=Drosophila rhopaloa TaxID=1041015 RepID=A0A6P4ETG6_DRORH|nr:uncharacterized protein LOC108045245 [Drosophila rhopaloa]
MDSLSLKKKNRTMCNGDGTAPQAEPKPLDHPNWDEVQQMINLKVAEAMNDFFSIHSKALMRLERLIQKHLLNKVDSLSPGDLREIAVLVRKVLKRLKPVFLHPTDDFQVARPQAPEIENPDVERRSTDVIFQNPCCTVQPVARHRKRSKRHPSCSQLDCQASRIFKDRERIQFEVNLVMLKKSLFSLHLNRNNRYWPRYQRASRHPAGKVHLPIDPPPFSD